MNYRQLIAFGLVLSIPLYLVRFHLGVPTTLFELEIWVTFIGLIILNPKSLNVLKFIPRTILVGAGLILIGCILGVYVAQDKTVALGQLKGFIITPLVFSLVILMLGDVRRSVINGLLTLGSLVGLEAIVEYLINLKTADGRVAGIFHFEVSASPNYLSLFLTPLAVIAWRKLINSRTINQRLIYLLIFGITSLGVGVTQSRAGLAVIGLIIILDGFIWFKNRYLSLVFSYIFGLVLGVLVIVLAFSIASPQLSANPQSGRVATSNNIRYEIWKVSIKEIIPNHFVLGIGLGNFQSTFAQITQNRVNFDEFITPLAVTPHNLFLATWLNAGLIGLFGLVLVIIKFFKTVPYQSIWFAGLLSILALGIFDTSFYKNDLSALFWIIAISGTTFYLTQSRSIPSNRGSAVSATLNRDKSRI